ncbi:SDR family NAD(P)-dependent oxidoreductase [Actinocorallia longicatena]|uniref:SDR family NAD(P)-dependent oxidoreductase n=1 Tax=Actinocorallia longicatena TaxID=111803 RepID=A0ABP6PXB8_9ACTN
MPLFSLADAALDRSVVLGYTRIGYRLREPHWKPLPERLTGAYMITGATSGIGGAAAAALLALAARVHLLARDRGRGEAAVSELRRAAPDADVRLWLCDVSDLGDIARFAEEFLASEPGPLQALVHNAGVFPAERTETPQGHETALATHVLGPHLLSLLMAPRLALAGPGRLIWVTSGGMYARRLDQDDPEYKEGAYRGGVAYARTKRMQVVLAELWAAAEPPGRIVAHSTHPGWVDTPGLAHAIPRFRTLVSPVIRTPGQGADTIVWLCTATPPTRVSGRLWHDRASRPAHYVPWTRETPAARAALWDLCTGAAAPFLP